MDATAPTEGPGSWALEATTDCVVLFDRDFRFTFVNRHAADFNAVEPADLVGRAYLDVWPQDRGSEAERLYRLALATGEPQRFVNHYREADGREVWLDVRAYAAENGVAVFFRDVTERKRGEEREAEERERLASAMRATDLGVWRCNLPLDDHPFDWSPQVRRHFGIAEDEPVGVREFLELLHPDDRQPTADAMTRAIEERVPYDVTYRTQGRDGQTRWVRATGNAFYREDGTPYRFDGFTVELTALKAAAEQAAARERRGRLRVELLDALRGLGEPQAIVDAASQIVCRHFGACRAMCAFVNGSAETFEILKGWQEIGSSEIAGVYGYGDFGLDLMREIAQGRPFAVADAACHPLTQERYASGFASIDLRAFVVIPRMRDGAMIGMFSIHDRNVRAWTEEEIGLLDEVAGRVWDAFERARAEADLRALNVALDAIVRERTEELVRANEEMEAFNYSVAHDLRGPLRAIVTNARFLGDDAADRLYPEERRMLDRLSHNALRLAGLIDALLELARLSRTPLTRAEIDVTELAQGVADETLDREKTDCAIVVEPRMRSVGDARLVRVVFQNLIENACKFSPEGGTVRVGRRDGAFFVADEGIGFDMQYAAHLFRPFERLVGESEFPGTGIGLANVARIAKRHGGQAWAESAPSKGATFYFTLGEA